MLLFMLPFVENHHIPPPSFLSPSVDNTMPKRGSDNRKCSFGHYQLSPVLLGEGKSRNWNDNLVKNFMADRMVRQARL
jgi:hypothetical protein